MRESIANSYVFTIVIIFVSMILFVLVGSFSYSKAFKIKNKVIDIIEKNKGYDLAAEAEIDTFLGSAGYKVTPTKVTEGCPLNNSRTAINTISKYRYCVYEVNTVRGNYYTVTIFLSFEIPIISSTPLLGSALTFEMSGETKILYELD